MVVFKMTHLKEQTMREGRLLQYAFPPQCEKKGKFSIMFYVSQHALSSPCIAFLSFQFCFMLAFLNVAQRTTSNWYLGENKMLKS